MRGQPVAPTERTCAEARAGFAATQCCAFLIKLITRAFARMCSEHMQVYMTVHSGYTVTHRPRPESAEVSVRHGVSIAVAMPAVALAPSSIHTYGSRQRPLLCPSLTFVNIASGSVWIPRTQLFTRSSSNKHSFIRHPSPGTDGRTD